MTEPPSLDHETSSDKGSPHSTSPLVNDEKEKKRRQTAAKAASIALSRRATTFAAPAGELGSSASRQQQVEKLRGWRFLRCGG